MANEKKNEVIGKEELAKEAAVAESAKAAEAEVEEVVDPSKEIVMDFPVGREPFEYNGETRYNYFISVVLGGKEMKVSFESSGMKDIGAFEVFNLFYEISGGKLQFRLVPWTRKAEKKGEEDRSGFTYVLASALEPKAMRIKVKPKAESDKALLRAALCLSGYEVN